ncbi:MAG: glyoxalase [Deltaproteobacteria bacterium]|mgnify:CR=1 FL=1|jgi:catechol 2,3-dioxygenase-like lactoylglutathione lyase family enzyme|nr:glyoxalase [Deltaproteobacteria bacterium]
MTIRVEGYNHVGIVVKNLEVCKRFYGDILGLEDAPRPNFNFPGHWYQVGPNTQLHLMVYDEVIPDTMRHFALEVEDFSDALAHLEAHGIPIVEGPGKRPDGSDFLFCKDPDGNLVELTRH